MVNSTEGYHYTVIAKQCVFVQNEEIVILFRSLNT